MRENTNKGKFRGNVKSKKKKKRQDNKIKKKRNLTNQDKTN